MYPFQSSHSSSSVHPDCDKELVCNILNITNDGSWEILDSEGTLRLVHYLPGYETVYPFLRGVVVDTEKRKVVCTSYGYVPVAHKYELKEMLKVWDEHEYIHVFDPNTVLIEKGYEGTVIRLFFHQGKTYFSTHRRLNAKASRWGTAPSFYDLYISLGGPDNLFENADVHESTFYFLIVHASTQMCSWEPVTRLFFLGTNNEKGTEFKKELENKFPRPEIVSLKDIDTILVSRSTPDPRLCMGESALIHQLDAKGLIVKSIRLQSPGLTWRQKIRNDEYNLERRLFEMMDTRKWDPDVYLERFPIVRPIVDEDLSNYIQKGRFQELHKELSTFQPSEEEKQQILIPSNRAYNSFLCLMLASSPKYWKYLLDTYRRIVISCTQLASWLIKIEQTGIRTEEASTKYSKRVGQILKDVRNYAQNLQTQGKDKRGNYRLNLGQLIQDSIRKSVGREHSRSLMLLIEIMRKHQRK